jgi:putative acetyltransferase
MINIVRTNSENPDFIKLVKMLDAELAIIDGDEHSFYSQFNKIDKIKYAVVAYEDENPVGCGAMKEYDAESMEVKRMFVAREFRKRGIAAGVLAEIEAWATELSYRRCILETGLRQAEAIGLYKKCGYLYIPNYGQYTGVENSVCFEKKIR